ncbi:MAG: exonuclease domain-containing protein [Candidatus Peregrinibacteria bacterium]|nr:exonuclease domain-containing protein [Candidatus Peregrinibacteria bacterium]
MFISLDLETTGIDPLKNKIIEFGAVKFDLNGQKETLQILINPGIALPDIIKYITHITDEELKDAPAFTEKAQEIKDFIGDAPIVGHNIQFDISFLNANGLNLTNPLYDTFPFSSIIYPDLPTYSLEVLSEILNLSHEEKHRALEDSVAAMELFMKLSEKFQELPEETIKRIHELCKKTNHPLGAFLLTLKPKPAQNQPSTEVSSEKSIQENQLSIFSEPAENPTSISETQPTEAENSISETQPSSTTIAISSKILNSKENLLIELSPPYEDLIKNLIKHIDKDSYIAIPSEIFQSISSEIPDTVAKIESPKKYISVKRLEKLLEKSQIQDHEFTTFSKTIIWLNKTKTGLLHEISFLNQEKQLIHELNIDENLIDPLQEAFFSKGIEKDISNPTICSHHYLGDLTTHFNAEAGEKSPNNSHFPPLRPKNLIIIDFDKFVKTLHFESSHYLKLEILLNQIRRIENDKNSELIESLSSKATMFFGLIGIVMERFTDDNQFIERCTISQETVESRQWEKALHSAQTLIELLNETKDPLLEKSANTLTEFFITPNLDSNLLLIEKDMDGNAVIKKSPFEVKPQIQKILTNCESYKIINENVNLNDDGYFIKRLFGLPQDLKAIKESELIPSDPTKPSFEIFMADKPNYYSREDHNLMKNIAKYAESREGAVAIIANSRQQIEFFTLELGKLLKNSETQSPDSQANNHPPRQIISLLTGSIGKIAEQFRVNHKNSILILTPNAWNYFKYANLVNSLIVTKIPFDPPSDPYLIAASKNFENPFDELQVPLAIFALKRIINRIKQTANETKKEVIILDDRLTTKNYGKAFIENLKNIACISPFLPIQ